ncbi:putative transposase of IS4/5 family (DUF4096) [Actinoalloteichus cyanogriseus DSM 43889]|uniref:Transposase of IS4/5 family (DUF4096) n=1 Tax=Actinoalloteichus caeruleus DSM 43889 TaxID=1120930 RepID=A0ABT1JC64_ACTCY|nr:putative transposase of IS4/5 family (DUF4096) [Actinoalloteichus caeruleus DSM 43889]
MNVRDTKAAPGDLARRLVPDWLWELVEPTLPTPRPRPQGGGRARVNERAVLTAIVFVLTSGCAWRDLPASFSVSAPTAHRRFQEWSNAGVWQRLQGAVRRGGLDQAERVWARSVLTAAAARLPARAENELLVMK